MAKPYEPLGNQWSSCKPYMYIQAITTYIVVIDTMQANLIIVVSAYTTCSMSTIGYILETSC